MSAWMIGRCLALVLALGVAGCMTPHHRPGTLDPERIAVERHEQDRIALASALHDYRRLQRVAFPLLRTTATLPGVRSRPSLGVFVGHSQLVRQEAVAAQSIGLTAHWTILEVFAESPAAAAGLRGGDRIVAVNAVPLPPPAAADRFSSRSPLVDALTAGTPATLQVERDGEVLECLVTPVAIADYRLVLRASLEVNATATGRSIRVNRGCIRMLSDADLAFVLAHEMAHNALRHQRAIILNYLAGSTLDLAALGAGVITGNTLGLSAAFIHSRGFEHEADAVGIFILHRTGHDISDTPYLWRRLAAHYPALRRRHWLPTHPSGPERVVAMEIVVERLLQPTKPAP